MNLRPFLLLAILGAMLFVIGAFITVLGTTADANVRAPTELPEFLREASGLARVDENLLLTHNDEKGHIYSITLPGLQITKLLSLGNPVVLDDFEGIAVDNDHIYMITSAGKLYVIRDVSFETTGQIADWRVLDTGLAAVCEVEGLHFDDGTLLIPCKNIYKQNGKNKSRQDRVTVYSYMPGKDTEARSLFSLHDDRLKGDRKRITAIESDGDFYYLLTSDTLLRVHRDTLSLELFPLDPTAHKQPEGLALMDNGAVFLVDDRKKGAGGLRHYKSLEAISKF
jgi:hypothetical protein